MEMIDKLLHLLQQQLTQQQYQFITVVTTTNKLSSSSNLLQLLQQQLNPTLKATYLLFLVSVNSSFWKTTNV
jgi:hypothetical protein